MTLPFGPSDLQATLPEMLLSGMALLVLVLDFVYLRGRRGWLAYIGLLGILATVGVVLNQAGVFGQKAAMRAAWSGFYVLDPFALFFKVVFLLASAFVILMAIGYLELEEIDRGEFYTLLLFSTVGMMLMASSFDLLTLYLGLETMSVAIYALVGFLKREQRSVEAALKYLLMGIFSSGVLLYGIVLLYGLAGTTNLGEIGKAMAAVSPRNSVAVLAMILLAAGFGFKIAAVPFHMYIPDAYEGAPHPVTAFISIGPKVAGFAVLLRVFLVSLPSLQEDWTLLLAVLSFVTMTVGNVVAIAQRNVKRMLAYSSIAHVGYMLIGVVAKGELGISAVLFYSLAYYLMNLGAFAMVILLRQGKVKGDQIEDFTGLAQRSPLVAAAMLFFLLSLAGVPPTAGFVGKLYLFGAAINAGYISLAVAGVVNSAISLYYYMRVAMAMYMRDPEGTILLSQSFPLHLAIFLAFLGTLLIGIYPGPFLDFARASVAWLL